MENIRTKTSSELLKITYFTPCQHLKTNHGLTVIIPRKITQILSRFFQRQAYVLWHLNLWHNTGGSVLGPWVRGWIQEHIPTDRQTHTDTHTHTNTHTRTIQATESWAPWHKKAPVTMINSGRKREKWRRTCHAIRCHYEVLRNASTLHCWASLVRACALCNNAHAQILIPLTIPTSCF